MEALQQILQYIKQAKKILILPICISDANHNYIIYAIMYRSEIYIHMRIDIDDINDYKHKQLNIN